MEKKKKIILIACTVITEEHTRIVFFVKAIGTANGDVVRPPGELLYVGTKIGKSHRSAVIRYIRLANMRDKFKVLIEVW